MGFKQIGIWKNTLKAVDTQKKSTCRGYYSHFLKDMVYLEEEISVNALPAECQFLDEHRSSGNSSLIS